LPLQPVGQGPPARLMPAATVERKSRREQGAPGPGSRLWPPTLNVEPRQGHWRTFALLLWVAEKFSCAPCCAGIGACRPHPITKRQVNVKAWTQVSVWFIAASSGCQPNGAQPSSAAPSTGQSYALALQRVPASVPRACGWLIRWGDLDLFGLRPQPDCFRNPGSRKRRYAAHAVLIEGPNFAPGADRGRRGPNLLWPSSNRTPLAWADFPGSRLQAGYFRWRP